MAFAGSPANERVEEAGGGSNAMPANRSRQWDSCARNNKKTPVQASLLLGTEIFALAGRTVSHVKARKSAESGRSFDKTCIITGRIARELARTPGSRAVKLLLP